MSEDKTEIDYDAIANKINEKVNENMKGVSTTIDEKLSGFDDKIEKITALNTNKTAEDDAANNNNDDDEVFFSKEELKKMVQEELKNSSTNVDEAIKKVLGEVSKRADLDNQAFEHFPMLQQNTPLFNKNFSDEVSAEIAKRAKDRGINSHEDPYLLYDSAAAVYARNPNYQKLKQDSIRDSQRLANNREDNFNITGRGKTPKEPTPEMLEKAKSYGLSVDALKASLKEKY